MVGMVTKSENPIWKSENYKELDPKTRENMTKYLFKLWAKVKNGEEPDFVFDSWEKMQHMLNTEVKDE